MSAAQEYELSQMRRALGAAHRAETQVSGSLADHLGRLAVNHLETAVAGGCIWCTGRNDQSVWCVECNGLERA